MRRSLFFLFLISISTPLLVGQSIYYGYTQRTWDISDNLPSGQVLLHFQTKDGYLWGTSVAGLTRMDGLQVETFNQEDIPELNNERVGKLISDFSKQPYPESFWGTTDGDVFEYKNKTIKVLASLNPKGKTKTKLEGNKVFGGISTNPNRRYVVTSSYIYILNGEGNILKKIDIKPYMYGGEAEVIGNQLCLDAQDRLWIQIKKGDGPNITHAFIIVLPNESIISGIWDARIDPKHSYKLYQDKKQNIYFMNDQKHGLIKYSANGVFTRELSNTIVFDLLEDKNGTLWALTAQGVLKYTQKWERLSMQPEEIETIKSFHSFGHVFFDSEQNLWVNFPTKKDQYVISQLITSKANNPNTLWRIMAIGARGDSGPHNFIEAQDKSIWVSVLGEHILQFKPQILGQIPLPPAITDPFSFGAFQANDQSVWVPYLRMKKVVQYKQDGTYKIYELPSITDEPRVVFEPNPGTIWVIANSSLYQLNQDQFELVSNVPEPLLRLVYTDKQNRTWVIGVKDSQSMISNLYQWKNGTWTYVQSLEGQIRSIIETPNGTIWLGNNKGKVFVSNKGGQSVSNQPFFKKTEMDLGRKVADLYVEENGTIWAGTEGRGLYKIQNGKVVQKFSKAQGFPFEVVWTIWQDERKNFWFSGDKGIMMIPYEQLNNFQPQTLLEPQLFGEKDGMAGKECNGGGSHTGFKDNQGRIWLPCVKGTTVIDPRVANKMESRIVINDYQVKDHNLLVNYKLQGSAYSSMLLYRIGGEEGTWIPTTLNGKLNISHLPGGDHRIDFKIYGSKEETHLDIQIPKYWYETIWIPFILVLGGGLLVSGLVWYRNNGEKLAQLVAKKEQHEVELIEQKDQLETQANDLRHVNKRLERTQSDLQTRTTDLEQANQRLEDIDRAKSEFLAQINHDIRTPLSTIKWTMEAHLEKAGKTNAPIQYDDVQNVLMQTRRLARFMDQTMASLHDDFVEANKVEPINFELIQYLEDHIVTPFKSLAQQKGIRLRFVPSQETLAVCLDPKGIEVITQNILENALKFTPPQGFVTFAVKLEQDRIVFEVKDTGIGIPEKERPYVFDRFYRGTQVQTQTAGTGLGLAIVKNWVILQKGSIHIHSVETEGTTVTVSLPFIPANAATPLERPTWGGWLQEELLQDHEGDGEHEEEGRIEGAPKRTILLVEDEFQIRQLLKRFLAEHYHVLEASNGKQALPLIQQHPDIDLVITDYMMPNMNGIELLTQIKADPKTALLPIIMLTARGTDESRLEAIKGQVEDYCDKMIAREEFLLRIENVLKRDAQRKAQYQQQLMVGGIVLEKGSPAGEWIEKIDALLQERCHESTFKVPQLCQALNIDRDVLTKELKKNGLPSPLILMRTFRLERAKSLLAAPNARVQDVALAVGYENHETFTKDFTKQFGYNPSKVKKMQTT